jgi:hypothetical protein
MPAHRNGKITFSLLLPRSPLVRRSGEEREKKENFLVSFEYYLRVENIQTRNKSFCCLLVRFYTQAESNLEFIFTGEEKIFEE